MCNEDIGLGLSADGAALVGALTVQWDERLTPPLPAQVSPWEVPPNLALPPRIPAVPCLAKNATCR